MSTSIPASVAGFCLLSEDGSPGGLGEAWAGGELLGSHPGRVEGLAGFWLLSEDGSPGGLGEAWAGGKLPGSHPGRVEGLAGTVSPTAGLLGCLSPRDGLDSPYPACVLTASPDDRNRVL